MDDMNEYDVVVIGGSAAGLSAALVLGRARRRVAVIDAGEPRNAPAAHMQGFLSRDGMPPRDLLAAGRDEVTGVRRPARRRHGHRSCTGSTMPAGFVVRLAERSGDDSPGGVLVATGLRDELPDIPGVRERWGRDLLHCPYCHGYEVRDQPLGVLGGTSRDGPARAHHPTVVARRRPLRPHRRR